MDQFVLRHCDKLQGHWSSNLDTVQAQALNPANVSHWFEMLEGFITEYDIQPELIYGMDESGFPTGNP